MATLLLRLAGPLQAWGTDSKFETRRTEREPSKSGVIGMLAAAMGRRRGESVTDLAMLRFGVRVEQEGSLLRDFHIAGTGGKATYLTQREYLEDAVFLVGLESDDVTFLQELAEAVEHPVFSLFLGRRCCVPDHPVLLGIRDTSLEETLRQEPWSASAFRQRSAKRTPRLRMMVDALAGQASMAIRRDVPVSFDFHHRQFLDRQVENCIPVEVRADFVQKTDHDVWEELEGEV